MSEPLNTGIKRIIWIATDKRYHRVMSVWINSLTSYTFREWKNLYYDCYITKHEIWV